MRPDSSESLVDLAYKTIREAIVANELKPGEPLSEPKLAEQIGVSRTPIREAIKQLEAEGLVRVVPWRGTFVMDITAADIVAMYGLREALECYAVRFVPENHDAAELDRLCSDVDKSLEWIAAGAIDRVDELDERMHRFIAAASRNPRICELIEQLLREVKRFRRLMPALPGRLEEQAREHQRIVRALQAGKVDQAKEELRRHLRAVRDASVKICLGG